MLLNWMIRHVPGEHFVKYALILRALFAEDPLPKPSIHITWHNKHFTVTEKKEILTCPWKSNQNILIKSEKNEWTLSCVLLSLCIWHFLPYFPWASHIPFNRLNQTVPTFIWNNMTSWCLGVTHLNHATAYCIISISLCFQDEFSGAPGILADRLYNKVQDVKKGPIYHLDNFFSRREKKSYWLVNTLNSNRCSH